MKYHLRVYLTARTHQLVSALALVTVDCAASGQFPLHVSVKALKVLCPPTVGILWCATATPQKAGC